MFVIPRDGDSPQDIYNTISAMYKVETETYKQVRALARKAYKAKEMEIYEMTESVIEGLNSLRRGTRFFDQYFSKLGTFSKQI